MAWHDELQNKSKWYLKCMGPSPSFLSFFTAGNNFCCFLFAKLEDRILQKRDNLGKNLLLVEQLYSLRLIFFFFFVSAKDGSGFA